MSTSAFMGKFPAIVKSYDADSRTCRIEIPGMTDGSDVLPLAEIEYPVGSVSFGARGTDLEILPNDPVYIEFLAHDPRYPIITGYRCKRNGNVVGITRFEQDNLVLVSRSSMKVTGGPVEIETASLTHNGKNVGDDHTHSGVESGGSNTGTPT